MAVVVVSATSAGAGGSTSINKPASTAQGDLLVLHMRCRGATTAPTAPAGWSAIGDTGGQVQGEYCADAYLVAGASEPASYTWTAGTSSSWDSAYIVRCTGQDATTQIDDHTTGNSATASVSLSALTASVTGDALLLFSADWNDTGVTTWPLSGSTLVNDLNTDDQQAGDATGLASGSTGALTVSYAGSNQHVVTAVLVKAQASAAPSAAWNPDLWPALLSPAPAKPATPRPLAPYQVVTPVGYTFPFVSPHASGSIVSGGGTLAGNGVLTAPAQVVEPTAPLAGQGVLSAPGIVVEPSAPFVGQGVLSEAAALIVAPATLQGNGLLIETAAQVVSNGDTLAGQGVLSGPAQVVTASGDALVGQGVLSVPSAIVEAHGDVLVGQGLLSANLIAGGGSFGGNGGLNATAQVVAPATLVGSGALSSSGALLLTQAALAGNGAALVTLVSLVAGVAVMAGSGVLSGSGTVLGQTFPALVALSDVAVYRAALSDEAVDPAAPSDKALATAKLSDI